MNKFMTMTSVVALLTGISGSAFADHTTEHVVQNLTFPPEWSDTRTSKQRSSRCQLLLQRLSRQLAPGRMDR